VLEKFHQLATYFADIVSPICAVWHCAVYPRFSRIASLENYELIPAIKRGRASIATHRYRGREQERSAKHRTLFRKYPIFPIPRRVTAENVSGIKDNRAGPKTRISKIRARYSDDSGDAKQRYRSYGGYSSRIRGVAWSHLRFSISEIRHGGGLSSEMRRKIAPVPSRKALISTHFLPTPLSRFASKVRGRRTSFSKWSSDRAALDTPVQEINSFIITNNPPALLLLPLADIGDVKVSVSSSLFLPLSFLVANERIAEGTRDDETRKEPPRVCELRYNIH